MNDARIFIPNRIYFRIGDVAEILGVKPYVIRFWESEFPFVAPDKASSGQRVYRRSQIESLVLVKHLLHIERYSIEGAKKKLTELRKQAKLKDAMLALVRGEHTPVQAPPMTPDTFEDAADATAEVEIGVGSLVAKSEIEALQKKIVELQNLIRDPNVDGMEVPGLKSIQ